MPFGNTCNLACRTCSSYPSSRWGKESRDLKLHFPEVKVWGHNKFYRNVDFMQAIKDRTHQVVHVEFPGGEPFYSNSEVHADFLSHLAQYNPENISLHYITNGTKMPTESIQQLWKMFKAVDIQVSIDGVTDQFEYNRWPAKWGDFIFTLSKWIDLRIKNKNIRLSVSHTVSIFTLWNLPEFIDWCYRMNLPEPYLGLVSKPKHYSITIFPEESKHKIEEKLKDYPKLQPIINAMWAKDDSEHLDTTAKYVKIIDKQREQNFQQTFPETYKLLGKKCQTLYQLY
jgi:MoaA/NifB/PqqE/SkfB family radical SAM enzyme